ncbi:MAG: hypothetical protein MOIL_01076 [Candidatus Methanolliviera sp. GoM_oil]|nr:MAG: hypothetical protein MOIL_01076 [Candidatus Methanolliviera sp. GoM_oil]
MAIFGYRRRGEKKERERKKEIRMSKIYGIIKSDMEGKVITLD